MSYYKRNSDGVTASVVNYIISGALFITAVVFFILTYLGKVEYTSLFAVFCGLAFVNLSSVKAIYEDYDMANKFVRWILGFVTLLGALLLLGGAGLSVSAEFSYVKVLAFSTLIGGALKVFIANINDFIPAFDAPSSDFFKYYSLLIFIAGTLVFFSILSIFFNFYFTLLFVGNCFLVYAILTNFRTWMERKTARFLVYAIIFFVVGVGINLPIALAVNGLANSSFNISEANLFNLASNLYFALAFIMGIGFTFLTRLSSVKYNMSDFAIEILLLVIPVLAFGVQFLAFFYFDAFLIVAGVVLVLVALVVLLFKIFMAVIAFLGDFFVSAGKAIWYIISFKWITNQIDVLTSSSSSNTKKTTATPQTQSTSSTCNYCTDCAYHTITTSPKTGMPNCDFCTLKHEVLSYGDILNGCENFTKR